MKPSRYLLALALTACSLPSEPNLGGMPLHSVELVGNTALSAQAQVLGDSVLVRLIVANNGTVPGAIEFGACSFAVRGTSLTHSWDNRLPPDAACPDVGYRLEIPAGETRQMMLFERRYVDLRQSGGARHYNVTVYYRERTGGEIVRLVAGGISF